MRRLQDLVLHFWRSYWAIGYHIAWSIQTIWSITWQSVLCTRYVSHHRTNWSRCGFAMTIQCVTGDIVWSYSSRIYSSGHVSIAWLSYDVSRARSTLYCSRCSSTGVELSMNIVWFCLNWGCCCFGFQFNENFKETCERVDWGGHLNMVMLHEGWYPAYHKFAPNTI